MIAITTNQTRDNMQSHGCIAACVSLIVMYKNVAAVSSLLGCVYTYRVTKEALTHHQKIVLFYHKYLEVNKDI